MIDGKGLVAIHINGIRAIDPPHRTEPRGINPAEQMGAGRRDNCNFYLREYDVRSQSWQWYDYTRAVDLPRYLEAPGAGKVMSLDHGTPAYDWVGQNGYRNVGEWIDLAAADAGR